MADNAHILEVNSSGDSMATAQETSSGSINARQPAANRVRVAAPLTMVNNDGGVIDVSSESSRP